MKKLWWILAIIGLAGLIGFFLTPQTLGQVSNPSYFKLIQNKIQPIVQSWGLDFTSSTVTSTVFCLTGDDCIATWPSGGGGTPGGSSTQVQVNENNSFAGYSGLTYTSSTQMLTFVNATGTKLYVTETTTLLSDLVMTHNHYITTHGIKGDASDGLYFVANNGSLVADFGIGNTQNSSFYGSVNIDGNTRFATSMNGLGYLTAGALSATTSLTSITSTRYCFPSGSCVTSWLSGGLSTTTPWTANDITQVVNGTTVRSIATSSLGLPTFTTLNSYLTTTTAAATYYPLSNPAGYITSSALDPYLTTSSAATLYYPLNSNPAGYITSTSGGSNWEVVDVDGTDYLSPTSSIPVYFPAGGRVAGGLSITSGNLNVTEFSYLSQGVNVEGGATIYDGLSVLTGTVSIDVEAAMQALTFTNATGTALVLDEICLTGDTCITTWPGGSGTPGGSDTSVQINDGGSFGGFPGLTFNSSTGVLFVTTSLGINTTTNPASYALDIDMGGRDVRFVGDSAYGNGFITENTLSGQRWALGTAGNSTILGPAGAFYLYDYNGNDLEMVLTNTGLLGLGQISDPLARIHLPASTATSGGLLFGTDTNLYRSAINTLKTEGGLVVGSTTTLSGNTQIDGALNVNGETTLSTTTVTKQLQFFTNTSTLYFGGLNSFTVFNATSSGISMNGYSNGLYFNGGLNSIVFNGDTSGITLNGSNNYIDLTGLLIQRVASSTFTSTGPSDELNNAGYSTTPGDFVYLSSSGTWLKTNAINTSTASGMIAVALESVTTGTPLTVATKGSLIRNDSWVFSAGATIYLSLVSGAPTSTVPTSTDQVVRVMGWARNTTTIYFSPSEDYLTLN